MADRDDVAHLAKSYVHAYLRWFLLDDAAQEGFFEGPAITPSGVAASGLERRHAWMGKRAMTGNLSLRSRVIDDFERPGAFDESTVGGDVTFTGLMTLEPGWQAPSYQASGSPLYPCPHDTTLANIVLTNGWATPHITWTIPAAARNFAAYAHIGFRVALMYESMFNDGSPLALDVRLTDILGKSRAVSTLAYAEIPSPEHAWYSSIHNGTGDFTKSQMVMVKIPLSAYSSGKNAVDLANVTEVQIQLPAGEAQFVLDDLELSF